MKNKCLVEEAEKKCKCQDCILQRGFDKMSLNLYIHSKIINMLVDTFPKLLIDNEKKNKKKRSKK